MKIKKKKKKVHSPRIEHEHHLEAAPDSMLVNNAETSPRYALANVRAILNFNTVIDIVPGPIIVI